jgi:uncharacterized protein (DUF885 family)
MRKNLYSLIAALIIFTGACNKRDTSYHEPADNAFGAFQEEFLDAYWKQYPSASIFIGYGKYYDTLVIPSNEAAAATIRFSRRWLDSLKALPYDQLHDNNKISFNIIKNQLETDIWYQEVFKKDEWDASGYNLSGTSFYILNQPYAPLVDRLRILSKHLQHSDVYYDTALKRLRQPTREHIELAILQNEGGISVFEESLQDSIDASHLTDSEKKVLRENVEKTVQAIRQFIQALKNILSEKGYTFRSFRIGKKLFDEKFGYDLVTTFTPDEIYNRAAADKKVYHRTMFGLAERLWPKYYGSQKKPTDTLSIIRSVIDKIDLQHAAPEHFFDSLTNHVRRLKQFILEKDLFDFDTAYPMKVRIMPAYLRGVSVANAEFTPPYQTKGVTYYNIDDLTQYPKDKAESILREYNTYSSQLLSIHEAVPGHCLQGIYNNKNSPDVVRSVFMNGTMVEGWAVYTEGMMLENGWGNHSLEMELIHGKWKLRELSNVMVDYDLHVLNRSRESIMKLLVEECFQTQAQAEEKYHRATVSQVQLCSYYSGYLAIESLREEYKRQMGDKYTIKDFHEKFLSFGSSPIKYIRDQMLTEIQ